MAIAIPAIVDVPAIIPDAVLDIRYATANNFLSRPVYPFAAAYLRLPTAEKLAAAAESLRARGYRLVIYDAYRPMAAQRQLWAAKPDPAFVADPARGSYHNRAAAVDVALADKDGRALVMPSDFDDFSEKARLSYEGGSAPARRRRDELCQAMEAAGLRSFEQEWWHYRDPAGAAWPLLDFDFELFRR